MGVDRWSDLHHVIWSVFKDTLRICWSAVLYQTDQSETESIQWTNSCLNTPSSGVLMYYTFI